jgi:hypothetical protein
MVQRRAAPNGTFGCALTDEEKHRKKAKKVRRKKGRKKGKGEIKVKSWEQNGKNGKRKLSKIKSQIE